MRVIKKLERFILLLLTVLAFASCEKVIDVDLKDAEPVIVIEGFVTNRADSQYVNIHRSVPFGQSNVFPGVTGAIVTIADNRGRIVTLRERRPGYYMARNFVGRIGYTYSLKVLADGKEYLAKSTMPEQVEIDSLGVSVTTFLGEEQKSILAMYQDPGNVKNYYRFTLSINGVPSKNIFTFDDNFNNGKQVTRELLDFDLDAESGDLAEIELQCVDPVVYRYWQGLDQNENRGGASSTPANPVSNISNGALGYFSAHTRQREVVVIP